MRIYYERIGEIKWILVSPFISSSLVGHSSIDLLIQLYFPFKMYCPDPRSLAAINWVVHTLAVHTPPASGGQQGIHGLVSSRVPR